MFDFGEALTIFLDSFYSSIKEGQLSAHAIEQKLSRCRLELLVTSMKNTQTKTRLRILTGVVSYNAT